MLLSVESLSDRIVPSTLTVTGTAGDDTVSIDNGVAGIVVTVNGVATPYVGVDTVAVDGLAGDDDIQNNTRVNFTATGGSGDDIIFGGTGVNMIDAGDGRDVVYSLVGPSVVTADDGKADRIYISAGFSAVADKHDQLVTFFTDGRTPGSGQFGLVDGVLYLTPPNGGSFTQIDEVKGQIVVTTDWAGTLTFDKNDVDAISYFGGSGNDTYVNNTRVEEAAYGSAGDDVIVSGTGKFNLLKGSGGDDLLVANGKRADLSGNGGTNTFVVNSKTFNIR